MACYVVMAVISVCAYFVGAKRYNDLGKPPQLALILPAAIYFQIFSPILSDQLLPIYGRWVAASVRARPRGMAGVGDGVQKRGGL